MRWFKHFTDNHRGRSVQYLMDEMGHSGLCYFILMEMCAEKLERPSSSADEQKINGGLSADDCEFIFHRRVVESALRLRRAAVERLLGSCQTSNLFSYKIEGEFIKIKMPILLDLLDYDSKRSRSRRANVASGSRLDTYTDKDTDTEPQTETESESEKELDYCEKLFEKSPEPKKPKKRAPASVDPKASALVAHYCESFKSRHLVNPSVSRADSGILKNLFEQMGIEKAKDLISAYFQMPDAYVIKAKHPIKLLSYKINEVLVFAETGNFITNSQARQGDVVAGNLMVLQQMNSGGAR